MLKTSSCLQKLRQFQSKLVFTNCRFQSTLEQPEKEHSSKRSTKLKTAPQSQLPQQQQNKPSESLHGHRQKVTAQIRDIKTAGGVLSVLQENKHYLDGVHVAAAFNKVGKLANNKSDSNLKICYNIARLLLTQLVHKEIKISVRGVAQAIWCLGKLGQPVSQQEMFYLENLVTQNINDLDPQGLLLMQVKKRLPVFNAQDLSNVIWACARLRLYNRDLFYEISDELSRKLQGFNGQNIANLLWSLSQLGHKDEFLLQEISQQIKNRVDEFNSIDLATVAWSYLILGYRDIEVFEAVNTQAGMITDKFGGEHLVTLCRALRDVGCELDSDLVKNIEHLLEVDQARFDAKQVQQLKSMLESVQQQNSEEVGS